jgi:hypothetical protein
MRGEEQANKLPEQVDWLNVARQAGAAGFPFRRLLFAKRRVVCRRGHTHRAGRGINPEMALGRSGPVTDPSPNRCRPFLTATSGSHVMPKGARPVLRRQRRSGPRQGSHPAPRIPTEKPLSYFLGACRHRHGLRDVTFSDAASLINVLVLRCIAASTHVCMYVCM